MKSQDTNKFGLSKKTNIAIAAMASLAAVQNNKYAIGAVVIISLVAITYQFILDRKVYGKCKSNTEN